MLKGEDSMLDEQVVVSPAPHVNDLLTTEKAMRKVGLALAPAALFSVWNFGFKALLLIVISVGAAMLTEYLIQKLQKKTSDFLHS